MMSTSAIDVARAARLAAAVSANDQDGVEAVIQEAHRRNGLIGLVLALATRHVQIAGEFYDTDRQQILDMHAMDAMTYAQESE